MEKPTYTIDQVRLDIPLVTSCAYFFIDARLEKQDPWWGRLFSYLVGFCGDEVAWRHEPYQDVYVARPPLTDDQKADILKFLRTAPPEQIAGHRTLRRAVALPASRTSRLELVCFCFSAGPSKVN